MDNELKAMLTSFVLLVIIGVLIALFSLIGAKRRAKKEHRE